MVMLTRHTSPKIRALHPDTGLLTVKGLLGDEAFKVRPEAYAAFAQRVFASFTRGPAAVTTEFDVADAVWRAANDESGQLRFPAGADAVALTLSK